ncbi:DNA-binding FadR family transcriptional regulator [Fontibacillus solani]|uniref:DNA-binding FadR family transcriptional regulator n=1 Tax=Fontibacillus solani TaxID=1572857 RepID=A0A7W3SVZ1_9BACL|nr:FadR/GntR family transcriptional regulator [Fontibacillus solani]MBA9087148.1 DNA-binding FadR family transcriptional regulator [Fontibacillus solani]
MLKKGSVKPVLKHKLVDDVVAQLQNKISTEEIRPGDLLPPEPELMQMFGVGRSTIREAVRVLVHAGLLEKKQGYGTFLKSSPTIQEPLMYRLHRAELIEVFEARKMIELEIAKLAALRRNDTDLANMRQHLDIRKMALQHDDRELYAKSDVDFHMAIAIACKNTVIIDMFRSFSDVITDAMNKLNQNYRSHDPHSHYHEQLYEAIKHEDPDQAVKWTQEILNGTLAEL